MRGFQRISAVAFCGVLVATTSGHAWSQTSSQPATPAPAATSEATGTASRVKTAQMIRHEKVAALVADARKLYAATQFEEAKELLRQATIIDPQDKDAALFYRLVRDKILVMTYEDATTLATQEVLQTRPTAPPESVTFIVVDEKPKLDPPVSEMQPEPAANRAVQDRLGENLKQLVVEKQPLDQVLMYLRDNVGVTILVNWVALHGEGVEKSTPTTVNLKNTPFRKVLSVVLSQVGGGKGTITFAVVEGNIVITTQAGLLSAAQQVSKSYDIRDLVVAPATVQSGQQHAELASGPEAAKVRAEAVANLMQTIRSTVAPDSWKDAGGTVGTVREENGELIVNQTMENQVAVYRLLQQLREAHGGEIAMESRILLVPKDFLSDFRVGWSADEMPATTTAPGSLPAATAPVRPSGDFRYAVIDNWTLSLLLTATQADKTTTSLVAPRATVLNGGEAVLNCPLPLRYIAGFSGKPVAIEADPYGPDYAKTDTGLRMTVQGVISADRRFVVTRVNPVGRVVSGVEQAPAGKVPAELNLKIDKPAISTASREFTAAIPDGGTLLIDGGEVPATGNPDQTVAEALKTKQHMLILLRPNITSQRIEEEVFGAGHDRPAGLPGNGPTTAPTKSPGTVPTAMELP